jgi:hypothetical protein
MTRQEGIILTDNSGARMDQKNSDEEIGQMNINKYQREHDIPSDQLEKSKLKRACSKCFGHNVHRSRRKRLERWSNFFRPNDRIYRCDDCSNRFWAPKNRIDRTIGTSNGHAANGHAANGSNGHALKAHSLKKHASNGHAANGSNGQKYQYQSPRPTRMQHFSAWLYKKHNQSIGTLIFLLLVSGTILFFVWSSMDAI